MGSITRLIDQLRSPDRGVRNEAARQVWMRYFPQLLELARQRLHRRIRTREDEEDVAQDVYKSLCLRLQRGEFELGSRNDLWRLLVSMTIHKAQKAATRHGRQSRDVRRDQPLATKADDSVSPEWVFEQMDTSDPGPAEEAILNEELQRRLSCLAEPLRQIALWKLAGYTNAEIAGERMLNCAARTVERKLSLIREKWQKLDSNLPTAP
jgi:RNA polymerase sigma factor (sigma-70 family)